MDFIFVKSAKAGKEDFGSVYARVRTGGKSSVSCPLKPSDSAPLC